MRIISGKFRGKKLTKFNQKGIKPTTDKIRESVFNIIISYLKINGKNGENQFEGFIKRSIRKVKKIEEKFDLIFIDPPYQMNLIIKKTLKKILDFKIIKKKTLIVLEHSNKKKIPIPKDFEIIKEKYYGNSGLTLVKLK